MIMYTLHYNGEIIYESPVPDIHFFQEYLDKGATLIVPDNSYEYMRACGIYDCVYSGCITGRIK